AQEPIGPEEAVDLLVVEDDPAQRLEALLFAARQKLSGALRQIGENDARLGQLSVAMGEHRDLAHFVDLAAVLGGPRLALDEEIDEDRLPFGADEVEHERHPVGVSRLGEAIQAIFGHGPRLKVSVSGSPADRWSPGRQTVPTEPIRAAPAVGRY